MGLHKKFTVTARISQMFEENFLVASVSHCVIRGCDTPFCPIKIPCSYSVEGKIVFFWCSFIGVLFGIVFALGTLNLEALHLDLDLDLNLEFSFYVWVEPSNVPSSGRRA